MKFGSLIVCVLVLLLVGPTPIQASPVKRKGKPSARTQTESPGKDELRELLRTTQQAVEQSQAEARRAREQSEEILKRLEENTREISLLRQTIAELKSEKTDALSPEKPASEERLDRLQEQVDVNTEQIKEQAQTKVESDSRFRVKLFGMILANTYFNSNDSSLNDVPLGAPPAEAGIRKNNFGATLRQTRIGLSMEGPRLSPRLGEARLSAEAEFDFWGGTNGRADGDVLGFFRVITASARLDWEKTSLVVGQRSPLVSPLNPTSIAAVWFPPLSSAGNLWQWRPQIIVEHRAKINESSQMIVQGGVMTPFGESLQSATIEGGPGYESRIAYRRNLNSDQSLELGFGGYFHRRPFPDERYVNSYAITGDWIIPLGNRLELSGEAYIGRAIGLSERSGSRNDRLYAVTGLIDNPETGIRGIHSTGGWLQLAVKAHSDLDFNFAYGQDDPRNGDIYDGFRNTNTRFKNQAGSTNFIWRLRQNFLFSMEYRRLWTNYATRRQTNNHVNMAVGYLF